jgi:hypothetical protein
MVRANRYALAAAQDGVALEPSVRALHGDNPICVRVSLPGETGLLHVIGGTQRDNMEMMGGARRGGGRRVVRRGIAGLAQRRARGVALREAVRDGWDADAVAKALLTPRISRRVPSRASPSPASFHRPRTKGPLTGPSAASSSSATAPVCRV